MTTGDAPASDPKWMDRAIAAESELYTVRGKLHDTEMARRTEADMAGHLRNLLADAEHTLGSKLQAIEFAANNTARELRTEVLRLNDELRRAERRAADAELRLAANIEESKRLPGPAPDPEPPVAPPKNELAPPKRKWWKW